MAKVIVEKNTLIVIILAACLICCAVSAGISTLIVNSGVNTAAGEKGEKGDTGAPGPSGSPGATGQTGANGATGATGAKGDTGEKGAASADYDSGWVDIRSLAGQNLTLAHNLNTANLQIQIQGKDASGNIHQKYLGLASTAVQGWNQTYSETNSYIGVSIAATSDGGYIITGPLIKAIYSDEADMFLLKVDADGYREWSRIFDFNYSDMPNAVIQTADGGYAVVGETYSNTGGDMHIFLIKTNSEGVQEWNNTFSTVGVSAFAMTQTNDGGYAITGQNASELYVLKTYPNGTQQWINTYGGTIGYAVIQTADNGYAVAGCVDDTANYTSHAYLVKIDANGVMQWNKTVGANSEQQYLYSVVATSDGGYVLGGSAYPAPDFTSKIYLAKTTSDGTLLWNKTYGGIDSQYGYSVVEAASGGYVIAGYTYTYSASDYCDYVLLKTTADGTLEWNKTYTNAEYDRGKAMVASSDGGYAMVGYSMDALEQYGSTFLVKTFSNGTLDWSQTYGGPNRDYGYSVIATNDGGYAVAGYTRQPLASFSNVYLLKTAADGTLSWTKMYDCGLDSSRGYSVIQTKDGGYAITGVGDSMALLLKTDCNGTMQWSKTFDLGCSEVDGYSLRQTTDGGYAVAGYAYRQDDNPQIFLMKTDRNGALQWNHTYGGTDPQYAYSMIVTSDGGYAISGYTITQTGAGALLLKADANGTMQWKRTYNSTDGNYGYSLVATADGGYAIAGYTYVGATASADVYLIKTDANGTMQWNQTYGVGTNYDYGYALIVTADGGFAIGGYTQSRTTQSYDVLLVKTSNNGTLEWTKTMDGGRYERIRAIAASPDGSFVLAGYNNDYKVILFKATINLELGLANVATTNNGITVYRGMDDSYWQYVRIQIWRTD